MPEKRIRKRVSRHSHGINCVFDSIWRWRANSILVRSFTVRIWLLRSFHINQFRERRRRKRITPRPLPFGIDRADIESIRVPANRYTDEATNCDECECVWQINQFKKFSMIVFWQFRRPRLCLSFVSRMEKFSASLPIASLVYLP